MAISPIAGRSIPAQSLAQQLYRMKAAKLARDVSRFRSVMNAPSEYANQLEADKLANSMRAANSKFVSSQVAQLTTNHDSLTFQQGTRIHTE